MDPRAAAGRGLPIRRVFPFILANCAPMTSAWVRGEFTRERPSGRNHRHGSGWRCCGSPIGVAMAIVAARRFRLAQQVLDAARANARLLELTPARPLLVRADGRIEADAQLLRDLGLEGSPKKLGDLAGNDSGIAPDDLERPGCRHRGRAGQRGPRVAHGSRERLRHGCSTSAAGRPPAEAAGHAAAVVLRHQRRRGGAGQARAAAAPDRRRAQLAHPPDRGGAISDVVPRPRPQARPGQQRVRRGGRGQGRRRRHRARRRADRRARRGQRDRDRAQGAGERPRSSRACSRRSSAASGACCGSSTCRCRPARSPASRSTSRTSRTRAPSLPATSNRSASWPTG